MVYAGPFDGFALDVCGLLGRRAARSVVAVNQAWAMFALAFVLAVSQLMLGVDKWVHGRASKESAIERDVAELQRILEGGAYGRRIGQIKEQLARMEEHLRSTDQRIDALTTNLEALRNWVAVKKSHE